MKLEFAKQEINDVLACQNSQIVFITKVCRDWLSLEAEGLRKDNLIADLRAKHVALKQECMFYVHGSEERDVKIAELKALTEFQAHALEREADRREKAEEELENYKKGGKGKP